MANNGQDSPVRSLRSSFTKQPLSHMRSSTACGFGSAPREAASRQFHSSSLDKATMRSAGSRATTMGPAYQHPSSFGRQTISRGRTAPSAGFGQSTRLGPRSDVPGPGTYNAMETLGGASRSDVRRAPRAQFGATTRDGASHVFISSRHEKTQFGGRAAPGPGAYREMSALGRQTESRGRTAPSAGFGQSTRMMPRNDVPGPGSYWAW